MGGPTALVEPDALRNPRRTKEIHYYHVYENNDLYAGTNADVDYDGNITSCYLKAKEKNYGAFVWDDNGMQKKVCYFKTGKYDDIIKDKETNHKVDLYVLTGCGACAHKPGICTFYDHSQDSWSCQDRSSELDC